jgi:dehydrogenase/reductase SDR family protein 1
MSETAEAVDQLGGRGIAVVCDHRSDEDVKAVFQRVREEQGGLDILVNNVYATPDFPTHGVPFWQLPLSYWDQIHTVGLRSHYVASVYAAPMMVAAGRGLIANISSGAAAGGRSVLFGVPYGVVKAGLDRLTADMAADLRPYGVAVVSIWPGLVKAEKSLAEPDRLPPELVERLMTQREWPQFTGRAIAALAADPGVMNRSGQALRVRTLAEEYGFSDVEPGPRP